MSYTHLIAELTKRRDALRALTDEKISPEYYLSEGVNMAIKIVESLSMPET